MPKPHATTQRNPNPVTEARLEELLFKQTKAIDELLAEQANVILEAVDERIDHKLDRKFEPVVSKLDAILKDVQAHREEDTIGANQLRRHEDQLQDHAVRIKKLEVIRNS